MNVLNGKKKKSHTLKQGLLYNESFAGYLFIAPNSIGLTVFYIIPIVFSLVLGLFDWDGIGTPNFTGLNNFKLLLRDDTFKLGIINTFWFTIITVPCTIVLSTLLAVALNSKIRGQNLYRTFFFLPTMTMPVAVAMVWKWLLNADYGLVNYFLEFLGFAPIGWLSNEKFILPAIMLISIWGGLGYNIVILLSGLQGISRVYYEAAEIDGANRWQTFRNVTIPLLTPSIFFVSVTSLISATQVFDPIFVILGATKGSLRDACRSIVFGIYENGFVYFKMGYAYSQAIVLFLIILLLTYLQFMGQKKWVHYE